MPTDHEQVRFITSKGQKCFVDSGLFEILTALKKLGVHTQFSCENNMNRGYVLAFGRSTIKFERKIKRLLFLHKLSVDSAEVMRSFIKGGRIYDVDLFFKRNGRMDALKIFSRGQEKHYTPYLIERSCSNKYGYHVTYRWPYKDTGRLLKALNEIVALTT